MHGARALQRGKPAVGAQAEGEAQFRHGAGGGGPARRIACQGGEVAFEIEARQGQVGLGLEPDSLDPASGVGCEL